MKIGVRIMPRKEVLDSQGRAVENTLHGHGHPDVACTVGKYIVLSLPKAGSREQALAQARAMAELVLYNPLIETYELEAL
jgi:phosphoribosylformylglycinamidine (FGAM) synthase PurS component